MTEEIKNRIELIRTGKTPDGYIKQYKYIFPASWHLYRLGDITTCSTQRNIASDELPSYSINNQVGFVPQNEQFEEGSYADLNKESYKIVKKGDFAYNPARVNVGSLGLLKDKDAVIISSLYVCFSLHQGFCNTYFDIWFKSPSFHKETLRNLEGSVREYLFYENFSNIRLPLPALPEQQKIAEILMQCDKVLELKQTKIAELKNLKKACLDKMFPKEGSNIPEVRFPGFTDAWEQRKLGELAEFNPKAELPEVFEYVDLESVVGTEMIAHREENKATAPSRAQRLALQGDLFYQTVRPYQKNNYLFEKPDKCYVFSTGYAQMRPYQDGYFLLCLVQNERFVKVVLDNCTGTSYPAINSNDLAQICVYYPSDKKEQEAIGAFFRNLDDLITLHQRELDETQKFKKALMQLLLTGIVRVTV